MFGSMPKQIIAIAVVAILLLTSQSADSAQLMRPEYWASYGTVLSPSPLYYSHHEANNHGSGYWPHVISISGNLVIMPLAYNHMVKTWGIPNGKFHFKHDWSGDHMALNDEVSHLVISYKMVQAFHSGYKFIGYTDRTAKILGMIETAVIVTAVEYPLDAYNPGQGLGVSDLIFDYAGIGLAYIKISDERFRNWDLKTSVKSFAHTKRQVLGDNAEDYDNYIYWLTYKKSPAVFGFGYSTSHPLSGGVDKEFYLGIGTTLPDLLEPISGKLAKVFRWLEVYYFNLKWNFLTFK
jgi:hypothetical protein